jgi:hypothetical protein
MNGNAWTNDFHDRIHLEQDIFNSHLLNQQFSISSSTAFLVFPSPHLTNLEPPGQAVPQKVVGFSESSQY